MLTRLARVLALFICVLTPFPALAYIDPNAGGWLYQLLFPLLVAVGALWAGLRARLSLWWWRWRGKRRPGPSADESDEA